MRPLIIRILIAVFLVSSVPFTVPNDGALAQQKDPPTIVKKNTDRDKKWKKKKNKKKHRRHKHRMKKRWNQRHKKFDAKK
jgi:hypothetical protein